MSRIPLEHERVIAEFAKFLYPLLPGSGAKKWGAAHAELTFPGAAKSVGLGHLWPDGSKEPAIVALLGGAYQQAPGKVPELITEIIRRAIRKNIAGITREVVAQVIGFARRLGYGVPELERPQFLESLPSAKRTVPKPSEPNADQRQQLRRQILALSSLEPKPRGYAFETLLTLLWDIHGLNPHEPYRLSGEQIDGSFELDGNTYIVEAKWKQQWAEISDLDSLQNRVARKSQWARGLFVSYAGFSEQGLVAFGKGQAPRILGLSGQDLYYAIFADLSLSEVIRMKRRAADDGRGPCVPVSELFPKVLTSV